MLLLVDNYDSFTYNLVDYFSQLGQECIVVKNDVHPSEILDLDSISGLVLSPGPGRPDDSGYLMEYLDWFENRMPILGICLGHQAIALRYGAKVVKAIKPMHGKLSTIFTNKPDEILQGLPVSFRVVRYHSLVIDLIGSNFIESLASTEEGENMIIKHKNKVIYGLQYHPEAILTENGMEILDNWLQIVESNTKVQSTILHQ